MLSFHTSATYQNSCSSSLRYHLLLRKPTMWLADWLPEPWPWRHISPDTALPRDLLVAGLTFGIVLLLAGALFGFKARSAQPSATKAMTSGFPLHNTSSTDERDAAPHTQPPERELPPGLPLRGRRPSLKHLQFLKWLPDKTTTWGNKLAEHGNVNLLALNVLTSPHLRNIMHPIWCGSQHTRVRMLMCSQPSASHQGHRVLPWEHGWWCYIAQHLVGLGRQLPPSEPFAGDFCTHLWVPAAASLPQTDSIGSCENQEHASSATTNTSFLVTCSPVFEFPCYHRPRRTGSPVGKANLQPVVRLVADTTSHVVACGEVLIDVSCWCCSLPACASGLAGIQQLQFPSPGLPFHSKGPFPHLLAPAISQPGCMDRHGGKCCCRYWRSVCKSYGRQFLWEHWKLLWWDSSPLTFCCQKLILLASLLSKPYLELISSHIYSKYLK